MWIRESFFHGQVCAGFRGSVCKILRLHYRRLTLAAGEGHHWSSRFTIKERAERGEFLDMVVTTPGMERQGVCTWVTVNGTASFCTYPPFQPQTDTVVDVYFPFVSLFW